MKSTCAFITKISADNEALKEAILLRRELEPGVVCHNVGGWHSERDLHLWLDPCVRDLFASIGGKMHTAWANINGPGDFNRAHTHQGPFTRSGVYVVQGDSGSLVFEPAGPVVDPEPGLLVVFPSGARHRVEPYEGSRHRITVAFNFKD